MGESSHDAVQPSDAKAILSYASSHTPTAGKLVTVGRYPNAMMAAMDESRLMSEGTISSQILNSNVNALGAPYSGFTDVELQVLEEDAAAAREILNTSWDELEPAREGEPDAGTDEDGQPITPAVAAAYSSVREMREAMSVLGSARVRYFPVPLRRRGDKPPGVGKRFVLRVSEDDLERARRLLDEAESEAREDDDPRCPRCRSYQIYVVPQMWKSFCAFWGIGKRPAKEMECVACHFRAPSEEFEKPQ